MEANIIKMLALPNYKITFQFHFPHSPKKSREEFIKLLIYFLTDFLNNTYSDDFNDKGSSEAKRPKKY